MERKKLTGFLLGIIAFYVVFVSIILWFRKLGFDVGNPSTKSILLRGVFSTLLSSLIMLGIDKLRRKKALRNQ